MKKTPFALIIFAALAPALSQANMIDNASLPQAVRVPAGHVQSLWTVGKGEITYACKLKPDQSGFAWTFVAPVAGLWDSGQTPAGKYYAGPTWEAMDGSKTMGKQLATAPAGEGNIPLQLVQASPQTAVGKMSKVTYIQRLKTVGGTAPAQPCSAETAGQERKVSYQADYVFYEASMAK
jgi:hypothetical protein